jgi:hypothetical protein
MATTIRTKTKRPFVLVEWGTDWTDPVIIGYSETRRAAEVRILRILRKGYRRHLDVRAVVDGRVDVTVDPTGVTA